MRKIKQLVFIEVCVHKIHIYDYSVIERLKNEIFLFPVLKKTSKMQNPYAVKEWS